MRQATSLLRLLFIVSSFLPAFGCRPDDEAVGRDVRVAPTPSPHETARPAPPAPLLLPEKVASGVVHGTVVYTADPARRWRQSRYYVKSSRGGALAEAVVALREPNSDRRRPAGENKTWTIDQKDYQFTPETIAIRARDSVRFTNSDPAVHNVRTSDGQEPFNVSLTAGKAYVHRFSRGRGIEEPIRLGCVFHGTMRAWIFVFEHPFFHLTDEDGRFRFDDVPPGTYRLEMIHPAGELEWSREIEIKSGGALPITIGVSADNRTLATNADTQEDKQ